MGTEQRMYTEEEVFKLLRKQRELCEDVAIKVAKECQRTNNLAGIVRMLKQEVYYTVSPLNDSVRD